MRNIVAKMINIQDKKLMITSSAYYTWALMTPWGVLI